MDIVPLVGEAFDRFLAKSKKIHKEAIAAALERYDRDIYCRIDRKRFLLVRLDGRTLLSSLGAITFRRRYYYDAAAGSYVHLLDAEMGLPKHKRMTNELILRMMDLASVMTYREVGEHLSDEFAVSKYTVWKTIRESLLEARFDARIDRGGRKVHVQVDEKFIGMVGSRSKRRYYTATVFAGREPAGNSHRLLNKTVVSSPDLGELKARLSRVLADGYGVSPGEEVFVSGDLAGYIQSFGDSLTCCRARYVPDRFHVYRTLRDCLPGVYADDLSLNDAGFRAHLVRELSGSGDEGAAKLRRLLERNPGSLAAWLDPEYLGCSQEGQNSHVYAPRFGRCASRFSPSTICKLSLIREAKAMGAKVVLRHKRRRPPEPVDYWSPSPYEEPAKYALDTRGMQYETAKMFNQIKFGGL